MIHKQALSKLIKTLAPAQRTYCIRPSAIRKLFLRWRSKTPPKKLPWLWNHLVLVSQRWGRPNAAQKL